MPAAEHLRELTPIAKKICISEKLVWYRGVSAPPGFLLREVEVWQLGGDLPRPPHSAEPHGLRLPFISPTFLSHTHVSNPPGRKREITDLCQLCTFSPPPFHKTTLSLPSKEQGVGACYFSISDKRLAKEEPDSCHCISLLSALTFPMVTCSL